MRKLLFFIVLASLVSCIKDREVAKLPKPLREVVNHADCNCNPALTKILWHQEIYYVLANRSQACNGAIKYYDKHGNPFTPMWVTLEAGQFIETVWECK